MNGDPSCEYTWEEFRPKIIVSVEELKPLTEGTDYDLSYQNDVNVGYAVIIATGKGNYVGELRTVFRILPAFSDSQAKLFDDAIYVGKTTKLEYSGGSGRVELKSTNDSVAKINADGTITGLNPGSTYIRIHSAKDENHDSHWEEFGPLLVSNREPSRYELDCGYRQTRTDLYKSYQRKEYRNGKIMNQKEFAEKIVQYVRDALPEELAEIEVRVKKYQSCYADKQP